MRQHCQQHLLSAMNCRMEAAMAIVGLPLGGCDIDATIC